MTYSRGRPPLLTLYICILSAVESSGIHGAEPALTSPLRRPPFESPSSRHKAQRCSGMQQTSCGSRVDSRINPARAQILGPSDSCHSSRDETALGGILNKAVNFSFGDGKTHECDSLDPLGPSGSPPADDSFYHFSQRRGILSRRNSEGKVRREGTR